ncbi:MAG: hypothetical protein V4615_06765 [Bacteroidota bacterium]
MFSLIIYILIAAIGFMMGFLYKRSHTTSQFFNPDPKKAMRIFLLVLLAGTLVNLLLSWLATYVLKSAEIPEDGNFKYHDTKSVMVFVINLFFFILVVLANAYSQTVKKVAFVPYLLALTFYMVFVLTDAYYVSDYFAIWQKSLQLFQGNLTDLHNTARIKCSLAFVVTAFNAFMIWGGLRK